MIKPTKEAQKETGRKAMNMKARSVKEMAESVEEWVDKKFFQKVKTALRNSLYPGNWKYELVIHRVKFPEEVKLVEKKGIKIHKLENIVLEFGKDEKSRIPSASGTDLLELVMLGRNGKI
jgi:vacuolar-type H+-ATPase subunit E/Vma4